ncbi:hypothetical protein BDY24DRAFT_398870 [Mrakia frigida]|uniref:uncharacterized protein n=1 Tax=Mrakia frigida TaxID=29902 RepID=UPI003FCC07FB
MVSMTPPRFSATAPIARRTFAQHAKLIATFSHPGMPVEVYPLIGCCLFSLTYIAVRFYETKDVTDVQFFHTGGELDTFLQLSLLDSPLTLLLSFPPALPSAVPWANIPQNDGRNLTSMVQTGDGITSRKFSYPKPKSFWESKFTPESPRMA